MSENEKLLNCPFCGDRPEARDLGRGVWKVVCTRCGCRTDEAGSVMTARVRWNNRQPAQSNILNEFKAFLRTGYTDEATDIVHELHEEFCVECRRQPAEDAGEGLPLSIPDYYRAKLAAISQAVESLTGHVEGLDARQDALTLRIERTIEPNQAHFEQHRGRTEERLDALEAALESTPSLTSVDEIQSQVNTNTDHALITRQLAREALARIKALEAHAGNGFGPHEDASVAGVTHIDATETGRYCEWDRRLRYYDLVFWLGPDKQETATVAVLGEDDLVERAMKLYPFVKLNVHSKPKETPNES